MDEYGKKNWGWEEEEEETKEWEEEWKDPKWDKNYGWRDDPSAELGEKEEETDDGDVEVVGCRMGPMIVVEDSDGDDPRPKPYDGDDDDQTWGDWKPIEPKADDLGQGLVDKKARVFKIISLVLKCSSPLMSYKHS